MVLELTHYIAGREVPAHDHGTSRGPVLQILKSITLMYCTPKQCRGLPYNLCEMPACMTEPWVLVVIILYFIYIPAGEKQGPRDQGSEV
jgi:hypothetical protein